MPTFKLIQRGWETYTGDLGQVQFVDGIATGDYPQTYIDRIAASFQIHDVDNDVPAGAAHRLIGAKALVCPVAQKLEHMTSEQIALANAAAVQIAARTLHPSEYLTRTQLEAIVDSRGIQGLREIAQPYGVKAKAITDLIVAILKAQEVVKAAQLAATASAPRPVLSEATVSLPAATAAA